MPEIEFMQVLAVAMAALVSDLSIALNLPFPFTAEQLAAAVAQWRRIRIEIKPHHMGKAKVYGLCKCVRADHYIIFYRADGVTYIQQQRIIFHELCHIILSHVSPLNPVHELRDELTVTLQDQEAEMFASIANKSALALGSKLTVAKVPMPDREGGPTFSALFKALHLKAPAASKDPTEGEPADQFDEFLKVMGG